MKINIDTARLELPGPGAAGAWVEAPQARPVDRLGAIRELQALGVSSLEIRRLLRALTHAAMTMDLRGGWPTLVEDHAVLCAAADLAQGLAEIFQGASPRAQSEFATAAKRALGDPAYPDEAQTCLTLFAAALRARTSEKPPQARRQPAVEIVRAVSTVAGHRLGAVSWSDGTPFRRACVAAFALAGRHASPDRAIQHYRKTLNDSL